MTTMATFSTATTPTKTTNQESRTLHEHEASGILEDLLKDNDVFLGGSSIGKGFKKAAKTYLKRQHLQEQQLLLQQQHGATTTDDNNTCTDISVEDAFYVVDLGVVTSQVYQWRKYFPRVEIFYAVKCNPDPLIIQTLALLGCHFDCASQSEMALVRSCTNHLALPHSTFPTILFANPCKSRSHLRYAVHQANATLVTYDNVQEVAKCASISDEIQLILRIVTDDRGSQCRLSSKYGAPKTRWRNLLQAAKHHGLEVVGVSFHVGSGCRDASRYESALQDARELFDLASGEEFGFTDMTILDIGGGFPGETHSVWNPEVLDELLHDEVGDDDSVTKEGLELERQQEKKDNTTATNNSKEGADGNQDDEEDTPYMFFREIAEQVAPMIDRLFPSPNIRVIGEPGRYFVAAAATLVTSIVGARSNDMDERTNQNQEFVPQPIPSAKTSHEIFERSRKDEDAIVRKRGKSFDFSSCGDNHHNHHAADDEQQQAIWDNITEELNTYAKYFAKQNFVTQETDAYNDGLDLYKEDIDTAVDLLGVPDKTQMQSIVHSVEGMTKAIAVGDDDGCHQGIISLAAAGEAAVNGMVMQAVADSSPLQDDYAYYVNDGVYGAFNNLMFDHATVRPRVLRLTNHYTTNHNDGGDTNGETTTTTTTDGITSNPSSDNEKEDQNLYASTVFGPTCDSIDVIARSVLLPKLKIGDWLYFQNMGAYTMAAASSFNGFEPTKKMYVCSVQPEFFEELMAGPPEEQQQEQQVDGDAADDNNSNKNNENDDKSPEPSIATEEKKDD